MIWVRPRSDFFQSVLLSGLDLYEPDLSHVFNVEVEL